MNFAIRFVIYNNHLLGWFWQISRSGLGIAITAIIELLEPCTIIIANDL